jgi:hypothetical protein
VIPEQPVSIRSYRHWDITYEGSNAFISTESFGHIRRSKNADDSRRKECDQPCYRRLLIIRRAHIPVLRRWPAMRKQKPARFLQRRSALPAYASTVAKERIGAVGLVKTRLTLPPRAKWQLGNTVDPLVHRRGFPKGPAPATRWFVAKRIAGSARLWSGIWSVEPTGARPPLPPPY